MDHTVFAQVLFWSHDAVIKATPTNCKIALIVTPLPSVGPLSSPMNPNLSASLLSTNLFCYHQIQNNSARMLLNDAQRIVMQGLQHIYMEGSVGNYSSCINRMELSLCSPEADDCFNRTLTSIRNASTQSDSVSYICIGQTL